MVHGRRADGSAFLGHDSGHGGWGAGSFHDGAGPFRTMAHGDTRLIPMELQETILPYRVDRLELRADSGGAGKFRGGLGFRKKYVILAPCLLVTNVDRTKYPPWGVQGGKAAMPGCVTLYRPDGTSEIVSKVKNYKLSPGDVVVLETGGGGGWGPPEERDPAAREADLADGKVSG
jgi:N-methylhydantoinase B